MLFRRWVVGVDVGDDGVDLANGGTRESRRVVFGDEAERNKVFTLSLSMDSANECFLLESENRMKFNRGETKWSDRAVRIEGG